MPEKAQQLRRLLAARRKEVGAQMPTPNPTYDPARPEHEQAGKQKKVADQ